MAVPSDEARHSEPPCKHVQNTFSHFKNQLKMKLRAADANINAKVSSEAVTTAFRANAWTSGGRDSKNAEPPPVNALEICSGEADGIALPRSRVAMLTKMAPDRPKAKTTPTLCTFCHKLVRA